jgi:glucosamine--fructose-6-phosphate aminotransferase (isomerizing)
MTGARLTRNDASVRKYAMIPSMNRRRRWSRRLRHAIVSCLRRPIYIGKHLAHVPPGAIVLFPCRLSQLNCGIAGIVAIKNPPQRQPSPVLMDLKEILEQISALNYNQCVAQEVQLQQHYLCGQTVVTELLNQARRLKTNAAMHRVLTAPSERDTIQQLVKQLDGLIENEQQVLTAQMGHLEPEAVEIMIQRIEILKDVAWCLQNEILANVDRIMALAPNTPDALGAASTTIYKQLNTVLNSLDRLEVRGRDSAGIALLFELDRSEFLAFGQALQQEALEEDFNRRCGAPVLVNHGISVTETDMTVSMALTYKIAAEIGRLGDNVQFLRQELQQDRVLHALIARPHLNYSVSAHTRWASVGAITEANCHPVDNDPLAQDPVTRPIIQACLNGDIDNYRDLAAQLALDGIKIPEEITTDTKIIPLQIEKYVRAGQPIDEAFRRAVNDFQGSHAISMQTDLAPGKLFLAQRGSGQAIFVGLSDDHYMPASEVYGFVEETAAYLKLDGEQVFEGPEGPVQGQIFILNPAGKGGLSGITAMFYDGSAIPLCAEDIKHTEITSRDIDRQAFPHYFLKEITEAPDSVAKTLQNRWKIYDGDRRTLGITLEERAFPKDLQQALEQERIRRIFFVGQGTAGVAALACANILDFYLNDPAMQISSLKASELSGFTLHDDDKATSMSDALVVAISQSGTTTDTNRTVDMVRARGAHTLAIVNRRDSDITFKVDGVIYTSSGRDIEMSVASTKAFYSQIVAGALLGLTIAKTRGQRDALFISAELERLLELPQAMRKILALQPAIEASAKSLAVRSTYWAAVGSGPNKASADEIRIKLSELCYKTISSDFVEDKKHIDLSSEPLIIVCAAGTRNTVIGDIIKDTAIFKAHKATPVVIADEGEDRFDAYARDIFHVPAIREHLAPIVNTLVGHIWGYYAALAINDGSRLLHQYRQEIQSTLDDQAERGLDVYEVILDGTFREKIAQFYQNFRLQQAQNRFPVAIGANVTTDLTLLLKYLLGRLPVSDFELDFGKKGTALNILGTLFESLGEAINTMARPVDAIKHQAKTVTVGTSRISEAIEGLLFDTLRAHNLNTAQIINRNVVVLRNLQAVIARVNGTILYRIGGLSLLGEVMEDTTIEVVAKSGQLQKLASRVESDKRLKGTKRIITREGNVYIGKGRKDGRSILILPIISQSSGTPNLIEYLLLYNIAFKPEVPLNDKIKALGGKFEHIKNIVQESSVPWSDDRIETIAIDELFGRSAEKIGEIIIAQAD